MVKQGKSGSDRERLEALYKTKKDVTAAIQNSDEYMKNIMKLKVDFVKSPLDVPDKPVRRILTHTAIDRILSVIGGIEAGSTVELYGVPATGKTQICEAIAAEAEDMIIYIDPEHTFKKPRFIEICNARGKVIKDINSRLLLITPEDWQEQEAAIYNLPEYDDNDNLVQVGLVVLDSLMKHWGSDSDFYGRERLTRRQQLVRAELETLARYVRRHNGVLLFTNQVYDKPVDTAFSPPEEKVAGRGGLTVSHFSDYRIFLRKGYGNIRYARLVDSSDLPLMEAPFILDKSGILDIPDPAERAKAVVASDEYANKFLSGQVGSKPAGKDYIVEALKLGYITEAEAKELGLDDKEIAKALDERSKTMEERMTKYNSVDENIVDPLVEVIEGTPAVKEASPIVEVA